MLFKLKANIEIRNLLCDETPLELGWKFTLKPKQSFKASFFPLLMVDQFVQHFQFPANSITCREFHTLCCGPHLT